MAVPIVTGIRTANDGSGIEVTLSENVELVDPSDSLAASFRFVVDNATPAPLDLTPFVQSADFHGSGSSVIRFVLSGYTIEPMDEILAQHESGPQSPLQSVSTSDALGTVGESVTNKRGTIDRTIDRVPIAIGDATVRCTSSDRFRSVWSRANQPEWTGAFGCLIRIESNQNTDTCYPAGWFNNASNRFEIERRVGSTGLGPWVIYCEIGGTSYRITTTDTHVPVSDRRYYGIQHGLLRVKPNGSGGQILEIAMLTKSGTIVRVDGSASLPSGFGWETLSSLGANSGDAYLGARTPGVAVNRTLTDGLDTLMWFRIPGSEAQAALDDDDIVFRLLTDPAMIEDLPGVTTDDLWCQLGDAVDVNDNPIVRNTDIALTTSHYFRCPHQGTKAQVAIEAGTPILRTPYANCSDYGPYPANTSQGPEMTQEGLSHVYLRGLLWQTSAVTSSDNNGPFPGWQRISKATGLPIALPVPFETAVENSAGDRLANRWGLNPFTDTHSGVTMTVTPYGICATLWGHHVLESGYREVIHITRITDQVRSEVFTPRFGIAFGEEITHSYGGGVAVFDGRYRVFSASMAAAFARRPFLVRHDMAWDDFVGRHLAAAASGSASNSYYSAYVGRVGKLNEDQFVAAFALRAHDGATVGRDANIFAVIGSVSNFNDPSHYFAADSGEPLDGSGPNTLTLGDLLQNTPECHIYQANAAKPYAERDAFLTRTFVVKGDTVSMLVWIGDAQASEPQGISDIADWSAMFMRWKLQAVAGGYRLNLTHEYDLKALVLSGTSGLNANPFFSSQLLAASNDARMLYAFADPDGETYSTTVNAVWDNGHWGSRVRVLGSSDPTLGAESWSLLDTVPIDLAGPALRAHWTTPDGVMVSSKLAVQVIEGGPEITNANLGTGGMRFVDLSAALAEVPVLAGGGGGGGARRYRGRGRARATAVE